MAYIGVISYNPFPKHLLTSWDVQALRDPAKKGKQHKDFPPKRHTTSSIFWQWPIIASLCNFTEGWDWKNLYENKKYQVLPSDLSGGLSLSDLHLHDYKVTWK